MVAGNGDGTFQAPVRILFGYETLSVAAADFNNDGNMDLVTLFDFGPLDPREVDSLLGDGQGGFAYGGWAALEYYPVHLTVADFNADGSPDLAAADQFGNTVSVFLGKGDGTLGVESRFDSGPNPTAVTVGDFTGDGIPDLATTGWWTGWVDILPGRGDGTFDSPVRSFAYLGDTIAAADFNGDGHLDVVTSYSETDTVSVLLGRGDGTLTTPQKFGTGITPVALALGDFNGDRRPDVATADLGSNTVSVLLNDGNWDVPPPPPPPPPSVSINDVSAVEGRKGQKTYFTFTITLSAPSLQPVTVSYRTGDGTAKSGEDYTAATGTVTFAPGETTKRVTILVKGDNKREANETFTLQLFEASNAVLQDATGTGTLLNDD